MIGLYAIKEKQSNVFLTSPAPYQNDKQAVVGFKTMLDVAKEKNDLLFTTSVVELYRICILQQDTLQITDTEQRKICSSSNVEKCIEAIKDKVNEDTDDEYIH